MNELDIKLITYLRYQIYYFMLSNKKYNLIFKKTLVYTSKQGYPYCNELIKQVELFGAKHTSEGYIKTLSHFINTRFIN